MSTQSSVAPVSTDGQDRSIETLRGLAVLLMVFGHVIGDSASTGLQVADGSWLRYIYFSLMFVRMPLFTVISGYVYALRPVSPNTNLNRFMKGKVRRLLIPFLFVGTLQLLVRTVIPSVNRPIDVNNLWQYYAYGFDQFWFLQALFTLFAIVAIVEYFGGLSTPICWAAWFALSLVISAMMPHQELFSLWGSEYLAPYFLLGLALNRFKDRYTTSIVISFAAAAFAIGVTMQQWVWWSGGDPNLDDMGWLALLVGLSGTSLILLCRRSNRWLAIIGTSSYVIYLFHVFGTAGSRVADKLLGIDSTFFLLFSGMVCGVALPMIIERLALKDRWARLCLLGLNPNRSPNKIPASTPAPQSIVPVPELQSKPIS
ncbi:acyltransferase family protein [Calycomorphotria hydatis]|uniref:Acyltransferase family protein n=1 Tax=Calycomorphotria hydatis TaxID=2528027 RepID=A0A517T629_9PLAN|nr:acyltransferase [Calycomorphotria hydatis]QDT63823.1 Acyltransferase family protein [Calycomorphotria hydatis]